MKALHLICKKEGRGMRHLRKSGHAADIWYSGYWDLTDHDAHSVVGGMVFLHETKKAPSRFGGIVLGYERVQHDAVARADRIDFRLWAVTEGTWVRWRGASHAMASYGGNIDV